MRGLPGWSSAWLAFLEHDCYPMAREQLFAGLQGLGLINSENWEHSDALRQVGYYVEQQAQCLNGQLMVV